MDLPLGDPRLFVLILESLPDFGFNCVSFIPVA